jgi:hypothetical protein
MSGFEEVGFLLRSLACVRLDGWSLWLIVIGLCRLSCETLALSLALIGVLGWTGIQKVTILGDCAIVLLW